MFEIHHFLDYYPLCPVYLESWVVTDAASYRSISLSKASVRIQSYVRGKITNDL